MTPVTRTLWHMVVGLPWIVLAVAAPLVIWWSLEPVPVRVVYVAPAFLSQPAKTREEAAQYYVAEARGGGVLWRYVEYCVARPFVGTTHRAWVNKAMVWHAPDVATHLSRAPGCAASSIGVDIPTSSPTRRFEFTQYMTIKTNPIREDRVEYAPIALTILDGK